MQAISSLQYLSNQAINLYQRVRHLIPGQPIVIVDYGLSVHGHHSVQAYRDDPGSCNLKSTFVNSAAIFSSSIEVTAHVSAA